MIIHRIGSTRVSTLADLDRVTQLLKPGDRVRVELLEQSGFMLNLYNYRLGAMIFRDVNVGSILKD